MRPDNPHAYDELLRGKKSLKCLLLTTVDMYLLKYSAYFPCVIPVSRYSACGVRLKFYLM